MTQYDLRLLARCCPRLRALEVDKGRIDLLNLAQDETITFPHLEAVSIEHWACVQDLQSSASGHVYCIDLPHCAYCEVPSQDRDEGYESRFHDSHSMVKRLMPRLSIVKNLHKVASWQGRHEPMLDPHYVSRNQFSCRLAQHLHECLGLDETYDGLRIRDRTLERHWVRERRRVGLGV